jgi:hypothetical protein
MAVTWRRLPTAPPATPHLVASRSPAGTGLNRFDIASGPMAEAVTHSLSHLTDAGVPYCKSRARL